jgi:hypothetical protein
MEREKMMADLLIAITKSVGGSLFLTTEELHRDPNEVVWINTIDGKGVQLTLKNQEVIEQ